MHETLAFTITLEFMLCYKGKTSARLCQRDRLFIHLPPVSQVSSLSTIWLGDKRMILPSLHTSPNIPPDVSEWFCLTAFLRTADIEVHRVHTSRVIIAYTLESISPLTYITHNLQATNNLMKGIKNEKQKKVRAPIKLTRHWRRQFYISLQQLWRLN